jgi:amidophosphoribosyltransferase
MGVDMATYDELIAHHHSVSEIETLLGADSLGFMSLEGLMRAVDRPANQFCLSCFVGEYPFDERMGGFARDCETVREGGR